MRPSNLLKFVRSSSVYSVGNSSPVKKAKRDRNLEYIALAAFLLGGYWFWKARFRTDVLVEDFGKAQHTKHLVTLSDRVDLDKIKAYLEEEEKKNERQ
jgi:hypothetical protein